MEFDLENPLTSSNEHQSDTIPDLFASESDHMPSRDFLKCLKTCDFYSSFRQEAISLILQAQYTCNFEPFFAYLAINYMDRCVSRQEIPQGKPWLLRLLAISCLSLAAKMKDTHFPLSNLQREESFNFDMQTVSRMELLILGALNWRMRSITPFSFLHFFISLFELKDPPLTQALKDRATEIIFKAHHEIKLLEFRPSVIAASALLVASHELFPLQYPSFKCSIFSCECVNKENLLRCLNALQQMVEMVWYESMLDTVSSTRTPLSILDRHCTKSESETTSITTATALTDKKEIKRYKTIGYRSSE
ncbi:cyclin d, putative [Ricinus communis]|uniref:B-like cyclin n=1 Tax=Ricinus communis TaxID=3988 RepID=B9SFD7_RICCO|nr:cyclin d, putative [Ricinus communis]|eukprot:XP_002524706.1 putative cyclin-D6-1 isoform X1 [Ricinus communis]